MAIQRHILAALLVYVLALAPGAVRADESADGPAINYISADAVYVNVGSRVGLGEGSRIRVIRAGKEIAVLEVVHVSSHSASCRVVSQTEAPRVGDAILFDAVRPVEKPPTEPPPQPAPAPARREEGRRRPDRVHGNVSLQNLWQKDLRESRLSSNQPGINVRLSVDDVFGTGGELRIRHRTRLYHRSRPLSTEANTDEWTHLLGEFGVYFDAGDRRDAVGFGRVLNPYIRGLGYMDGGYASVAVGPHLTLGAAGGLDPDIEDSSLRTNRQKYGMFVAYERGTYATTRLATTFAFSGSYAEGTINREFGYVQNVLSFARRLSIYHSMEVDLNRGWRKSANGGTVSFSNTYLTANAQVTPWMSLDASYDARRNIRDIRTHASPDSLFDDAISSGYGAGVGFTFPHNVRLRARGGERRREHEDQTNRYGSVYLSAAQFPFRGHSVAASVSVSETPYITGYRPVFTYRLPVARRTRLSLGVGGYIYKQELETTTSTFYDAGVYQTIGSRYYLSGNVRRLTGDALDSVQMYTEAGVSF
jgi:hypothetical protein